MSGYLGLTKASSNVERIGALNVQSSAYGVPIALAHWGQTRVTGNLFWYGDFNSVANHESAGGKGGGGAVSSYEYYASFCMGITEGPFSGIGNIWRDSTLVQTATTPAANIKIYNELHTINSGASATVTDASYFYSDISVTDTAGNPFNNVGSGSITASLQYKVTGGVYSFYSGDIGKQVYISYIYTQPAVTTSPTGQLGMSVFNGTPTQSPWTYLTSKHPDQALNYPSVAYVAASSFDLGTSSSLPNFNFEVMGSFRFNPAGSIYDANPKDVVSDYLTNVRYGVGFGSSRIADLTQFSNYCVANGLFYSPAFTEQSEASGHIKTLTECVNAAVFHSEGLLKIIPYGDTTVTGNGVTFTPNLTAQYDLSDDDFICDTDEDPITVIRSRQADAFNQVQIEFLDRSNQYNVAIAEAKDQADINLNGIRSAGVIQYHLICDSGVAQQVAQIVLQRKLYIRNQYKFKLGWEYCLLEPMDIVTINDPWIGLNKFPVRIIEIDENENGEFDVTAEELVTGIASVTSSGYQQTNSYSSGSSALPGNINTPYIFEPPVALAGGNNEIWCAVSGGSNWGGCHVWASIDGQTYTQIGIIDGYARQGVTTSSLSSVATDPDTTSVIGVSLTSGGQLLSASQADCDSYSSLCYLDGEVLAYRDATLTGYELYNLSYLHRGLYGSAISSHAAGAPFARLDGSIFKYTPISTYIGKTIYLKFTSFNLYGHQEQSLSDVSAYLYSLTGGALSAPLGLSLQSPFVGTQFTVQWNAVSGADSYNIQVYQGTTLIRSSSTTTTTYTYSYENSISDGGPWRTLTIKVQSVSPSKTSGFSSLTVTNPEPAALTGITTSATTTSVTVNWPACGDVDLTGYQVWLSTVSGFTPSSGTLKYTGAGLTTTIAGLTTATNYYIVVAAYDKWGSGTLNYSTQVTQKTS